MTTDEVQAFDWRSIWGIKNTLVSLRNWLFGEHERPERAESFTPRRTPSECRCIIWHRIGARCTAHALALEAYYRTYNDEKRDDWLPQIRGDMEDHGNRLT